MLNFRLIVITDSARSALETPSTLSEEQLVRKTSEHFTRLAEVGVRAYQLREKTWTDRARYETACALRQIADTFHADIFVNDRPDIAMMVNAAGIHLPEQGWPLDDVQKIYPEGLVGVSCHSMSTAISAQAHRADYIFFGPIYETESKLPYGPPKGIEALVEICSEVRLPVFAVGGITPERAAECRRAGAHGVAVIGALSPAVNIRKSVQEFYNALGNL